MAGVPDRIDAGTPLRELAAHYERLQDRGDADDPPLPPELLRGTPESILAPEVVAPVVVLPGSGPRPSELVADVRERLVEVAKAEHPEFYANDSVPAPDPALQWMRDWRPDRG